MGVSVGVLVGVLVGIGEEVGVAVDASGRPPATCVAPAAGASGSEAIREKPNAPTMQNKRMTMADITIRIVTCPRFIHLTL
jgi:hypothetical protein